MLEIGRLTRLELGYVGETDSRRVQIDVSEWLQRWPGAVIAVWVRKPEPDKTGYYANTEVEDGILTWVVTSGDVSQAGDGLAQIKALDPDGMGAIYKSRTVGTKIYASLEEMTSDPTAPDPMETWANKAAIYKEEAYRAKEEAIEASEAAKGSAESAMNSAEDARADADGAANSAEIAYKAAQTAVQAQGIAVESKDAATAAAQTATDAAATATGRAEAAELSAQRAETDSATAAAAAQTATSKAAEAKQSAQSAATDRATAAEAAQTATSKAAAAKQSAQGAETDRATAATAAQTATSKAAEAKQSAQSAAMDRETTLTAADIAMGHATSALQSAQKAEKAAEKIIHAATAIEMETSGGLLALHDAAERPAVALATEIRAVQSGTGNPSPDNIRPLTGWDAVSVSRTGRNLVSHLDYVTTHGHKGTTITPDVIEVTSPESYDYGYIPVHLKAGVTYTLVVDVEVYGRAEGENNSTQIGYRIGSNDMKPYTQLIKANGHYRFVSKYTAEEDMAGRVQWDPNYGNTGTGKACSRSTIMLLEGNYTEATAPAFEAYQGSSLTAALPETVYGGTLDWLTGILTVTHVRMTLDGTENWQASTSGANPALWIDVSSNAPVDSTVTGSGLLCDRMTPTNYPYQLAEYGEWKIGFNSRRECLFISTAKSVEEFKAWLTENPVHVVYQTAEEHAIQLTPRQLDMLKGDNNVWSDSGDTAVSYVADTKTYVDAHAVGGSGGSVASVNGKTGAVVLNAADVGAMPADTQIVDADARKQIAELSEDIEELKENGGAGVAVDATLTESGKAADAAVVGQKIAEIDEAVFVTVPGKNLVNPAASVHGFLYDKTGTIKSSDTYQPYETSDFIPVEQNTDYTCVVYSLDSDKLVGSLRFALLLYDVNQQPIQTSYLSVGSTDRITFNSGDAGYVRVSGRTERFSSDKQRLMQVEKGSTFTSFEPYNAQAKKPRNSATGILYGKKWAVCGDSFTNGDYSGSGLDESEYKFQSGKFIGKNIVYPYIIAERNDMEIEKFFEGGRTLANPADGSFTNSITNPSGSCYYQTIPEDADYITIYLGINDSHHEEGSTGDDGEDTTGVIPLGTADDTDASTFCGAWNVVLPWLMTNRPNAHIGIIVSNGVDRVEYRTATIAAAKKWGIPYLDLNGDERCPAMIRTVNPDISSAAKEILRQKWRVSETNSHPNTAAQHFQSTFIENFLRTL